jgi:hypothetical protein
VDYARGDGIKVGPGGDIAWTPQLISDDDPWVDRYHGLWGLDTGDRFAGERAPAGPKYTRTGSVRQSWHDPLGFAGLDKVAPPSQAVPVLEARLVELRTEHAAAEAEIGALEASLPLLEAEVAAVRVEPGVEKYRAARVLELRTGEAKLAASRTRVVELATAIEAGERRVAELRAGLVDDPRAHLHHAAVPEPPDITKRRRLAETWAALSVGLLVASLAVVLWFRILSPVVAIVVLFGIYLAIESFFRKDVRNLILRLSLVLAGITMLILAVTFLRELLLVGLAALGLLLIADNVGELRRRTTR